MALVWVTKTGARPGDPDLAGEVSYAPLLRAAPPPIAPPPPGPDNVLVFTSKNGISAFCDYTNNRNWRVYTVGDRTAALARAHGFSLVRSAGADLPALLNLLEAEVSTKQPLYYGRGAHISGDLAGALKPLGFTAREAVLYETRPAPTLPQEVTHAIAAGQPITILVYSARGAQILSERLRPVLAKSIPQPQLHTISISKAVDAAISGFKPVRRQIAARPEEAAMLRLLPA